MAIEDDAAEAQARGWRRLATLQSRIENRIGQALEAGHDLSVSEFTVLDVLGRQDDWHMRMQQLANAVVLSQSATTRLVTRLEERGLLARYLCATDRRGIYSEVTPAGRELLDDARRTHDRALADALAEAADTPGLQPLVRAVRAMEDTAATA